MPLPTSSPLLHVLSPFPPSLTFPSQTVADRLDKLEAFLAECDGDERYHPMYGDWESYKAKRVTKKKGEPEDTRWQWIDRRRPEM